MKLRTILGLPQIMIYKIMRFCCGIENNEKINRTSFWTMFSSVWTMFSAIVTFVLLFIAYRQLIEVNKTTSSQLETTSAEFAHKIKSDLYTTENLDLINLFDNGALTFRSDSSDSSAVWFQLDTIKYKELPIGVKCNKTLSNYNIFQVDLLIQDFEDLAFYERKGVITIDYIYDQYAYYIEMLWNNTEIKKYILWQRKQPHCSNTYINFERLYNRLKLMTDKEN